MTKKEYLKTGYIIKKRISIQEAILEEYKANLDNLKAINYSKDKLQGGPVQDDTLIIKKLDKIFEVEKKIKKLYDELTVFQDKVSEGIKTLNNYTEQQIITFRYFNNYPWEKIAEKIGYSKAQTYRLHGQALENLKISLNEIE